MCKHTWRSKFIQSYQSFQLIITWSCMTFPKLCHSTVDSRYLDLAYLE